MKKNYALCKIHFEKLLYASEKYGILKFITEKESLYFIRLDEVFSIILCKPAQFTGKKFRDLCVHPMIFMVPTL